MNGTPAEHLCSPPPPSSAALLQAQLTEGRRPVAFLVLHAHSLLESLSAVSERTATYAQQGKLTQGNLHLCFMMLTTSHRAPYTWSRWVISDATALRIAYRSHDERIKCHRCTERRVTCCSRGLQLPGGLCCSQGGLLQRGLLRLERLLAAGWSSRPLLRMLLLQALLLLQLVLLLLLLLVRIDLQHARRPPSTSQMHRVVCGAL